MACVGCFLLPVQFPGPEIAQTLCRYPELYRYGPLNTFFSVPLLLWNIVEATFNSVVLFYVSVSQSRFEVSIF